MKQLRIIMVGLALMVAAVAMATEPSKITVKYKGKKYSYHSMWDNITNILHPKWKVTE